MVWHLLTLFAAGMWVIAGVVAVAAYRKAGGAQLHRDMQTAKRMTAGVRLEGNTFTPGAGAGVATTTPPPGTTPPG